MIEGSHNQWNITLKDWNRPKEAKLISIFCAQRKFLPLEKCKSRMRILSGLKILSRSLLARSAASKWPVVQHQAAFVKGKRAQKILLVFPHVQRLRQCLQYNLWKLLFPRLYPLLESTACPYCHCIGNKLIKGSRVRQVGPVDPCGQVGDLDMSLVNLRNPSQVGQVRPVDSCGQVRNTDQSGSKW